MGATLHWPADLHVIIHREGVAGFVHVPGGPHMSMDFETVKFLRIMFLVIFAVVGGAAGVKYGPTLLGSQGEVIGPVVGAVVGGLVGWNAVDLVKGRARK